MQNDVYFYDDSVVVETHSGPYKNHAIWHIPKAKAKKLGYFSSFAATDALDYYQNAHFKQMGWQRIG